MKEMIVKVYNMLYSDEPERGVEIFLGNAIGLASIEGIGEWLNPLFDAAERQDYLFMADILCHEILPKVA